MNAAVWPNTAASASVSATLVSVPTWKDSHVGPRIPETTDTHHYEDEFDHLPSALICVPRTTLPSGAHTRRHTITSA